MKKSKAEPELQRQKTRIANLVRNATSWGVLCQSPFEGQADLEISQDRLPFCCEVALEGFSQEEGHRGGNRG